MSSECSAAAAVSVAAGISQFSSTVREISSIIMVMIASTWPHTQGGMSEYLLVDRANLAKYLTIAKLKLENAIAMVRSGDTD